MISPETLKYLSEYLEHISQNSKQLMVKENPTDEELILGNLSCLIEEVWEVSSEVRKYTKMGFNHKKVENFKKQDLEDEIIDVLISNLLLAKSVGFSDLDEAIKRKIQKNNERGY